MEPVLFAVWCFVVAVVGGLVGLVPGNIRLPATLVVGASVGAATGADLLVGAADAFAASVTHVRAGRMNCRLFWWMLPRSPSPGSRPGCRRSRSLTAWPTRSPC